MPFNVSINLVKFNDIGGHKMDIDTTVLNDLEIDVEVLKELEIEIE